MNVEIASAAALTAREKQKIEAFARAKFGDDAEFVYTEDPLLLGGIRIRAGDVVYDGSLRGRLSALKRHL